MRDDVWFVYLARCADGTLYTGIARDVARRVAAHDAGKGARYTRGRGPLEVRAIRRCRSKGAALRLELAIKRLQRDAKESLADPACLRAFAAKVARSTDARCPSNVRSSGRLEPVKTRAKAHGQGVGSAQQRKPVE